jgi:tRNA-modifying protein YgfZ
MLDDRPLAFLLHERVVRVEGDDARTWLQGQVTCDVLLAPSASTYGLVLTATGHVLADVWVLDRGDHFLLRLPSETCEAAVARLDRFIVMEDVELSMTSLSVVHVLGEVSDGVPTPRLGPTAGSAGHDLLVEDVEAAFGALAFRGILRGSAEQWEGLRIDAGRPRLGKDFGEATLPQEAGLKSAVSFKKGCYFGQEPVVMLEHRGKPPKRLVHLRLGAEVDEGSPVTDTAGTEVGRITSSAGTVALALVKRRALEGGELHVGGAAPLVLTIVE